MQIAKAYTNDERFSIVKIHVKELKKDERFKRGAKKALKIILPLCIFFMSLAFIEPFLFMVWGSITLFGVILFLGPYLHTIFYNEKIIVESIDGKCPYCQENQITLFLGGSLKKNMSAMCEACGEKITLVIE